MRYTIEARELTREHNRRPDAGRGARRTLVEAADAEDAISRFVTESASELISFARPAQGEESIATVRKEDAFFLVRIYSA